MMPPQLSPPPAQSGPATMQQGNPGNMAAATMKIREGVKLFEAALPMIPMGTPLHEKVLKVTSELVKELSQGDENQALQLQALVQQLRSAQQQQPMAALSRMYPGQQQGPALPPAAAQGGEPQPQQAA